MRFRIDGADWPRFGLPALRIRTTLGVRHWQLAGRIGRSAVLIRVDQPENRCVSLGYTDPDGGAPMHAAAGLIFATYPLFVKLGRRLGRPRRTALRVVS